MVTIANVELDDGAYVEWAGFVGGVPMFATAEGDIVRVEGGQTILTVHDGLLCATLVQSGDALLTGGEDGRVCRTNSDGVSTVLVDLSGKWIDQIAAGPNGAVAFASGRNAGIIIGDKVTSEINLERTIEGLAFAPKGMRLALARYDGVELHWVTSSGSIQFLEWKGAHTDVCFSPDGKYVVSNMQENALHGWRLKDARHMQMQGYPSKVKSTSWSPKGKWLATSGAPAAIVWPFTGKDGPMGKAPKELGSMGKLQVTCVACHPTEEAIVIGYSNGMILIVKIEDGQEVPLRSEGKGEITSLNWNKQGTQLAFGSEIGEGGIIDVTS
ncbi:MAG: WD40 repeat domain-containing protein [Rhizobiaceae bacterium]